MRHARNDVSLQVLDLIQALNCLDSVFGSSVGVNTGTSESLLSRIRDDTQFACVIWLAVFSRFVLTGVGYSATEGRQLAHLIGGLGDHHRARRRRRHGRSDDAGANIVYRPNETWDALCRCHTRRQLDQRVDFPHFAGFPTLPRIDRLPNARNWWAVLESNQRPTG